MSFDFSTLITDRQKSDVDYARELIGKITNGTATEKELAEWNAAMLKGSYDYTDMNRVTAAMDEINSMLSAAGYKTGYSKNGDPEPLLPDGYTQLEYIESTGSQYIDTGVKSSNLVRVVMTATLTDDSATSWIFGGRTSASSNTVGVFWYTNNLKWNADYAGNSQRYAFPDEITSTEELKIDYNQNYLTINEFSHEFIETSFSSNATISLFALSTLNVRSSFCKAKMKNCSVYVSGQLMRDFIPCKNPSGEVGFYDLVSEMFFGNDGTGSFVAGPITEEFGEAPEILPEVWHETDAPNLIQINQYLSNVKALRSTISNSSPEVPEIEDMFTVDAANNIEKILLAIEHAIQTMKQTYVPCGATACGGDYF